MIFASLKPFLYNSFSIVLTIILFLLALCVIVLTIPIMIGHQDRQAMAVPPNPPTLAIQSATDSRGYSIPYNKLIYVPSECSPGTPNCPDILLHGKLSFKILLQNNNNPIDYLVCRLDGQYAYQAREYHYPCDSNGDTPRGIGMFSNVFFLPRMTWSHVLNPDGTAYKHTFTIMAVDKYGQYSNIANWKWRTGHGFD
jgi:hypothetical protein